MIVIQEIKLTLCKYFSSPFQNLFCLKMLDWKHRGVCSGLNLWKNNIKSQFSSHFESWLAWLHSKILQAVFAIKFAFTPHSQNCEYM